MTTRYTSDQAYEEIRAKGLLGRRQLQVYSVLRKHGPMTAGELYKIAREQYQQFDLPANSNIHTRLGELRDRGVAKELPARKCKVTNKLAIEWQSTNDLPKPLLQNFEKEHTETCKQCRGKGYVVTAQARLF